MHGIEASDAAFADSGTCATGNDDFALAVADVVECLHDGMRRRGAGRYGREVRASETVFDGNHATWHIGDHLSDKEGTETRRAVAFEEEFFHLVEEMVDAADARGQQHADIVVVGVFGADARVGDGLIGSHDVELGEQVVFACGLLVEEVVGVVALHFTGEMRLV